MTGGGAFAAAASSDHYSMSH